MTRLGEQTIKLDNPPTITDVASIVGPKEGQGPLAKYFDQCLEDEFWGEKTWEKAESKIIKETVNTAISKSGTLISTTLGLRRPTEMFLPRISNGDSTPSILCLIRVNTLMSLPILFLYISLFVLKI